MAGTGRALEKPTTPPEPSLEELPLEERIRERAHRIYTERGGEAATELEDWLQAEEELRQEEGDH